MYKNTQHHFVTHDGTSLFYQYWQSDAAIDLQTTQEKKAIVLFHRGHEHSGRMAHLVEELDLAEFDFFAWDARGHGQSPGARGDAPSFSACVKDIQYFIQHIQTNYQIKTENIAIIGQSVGAVLAATWVHDYAPKIRALCLASPAFDIKLYIPMARAGLTALHKIRGNFFINSYVKSNMLTHDLQRAKSYDQDDKIARAISVRMLLGLYDAADRIVADAQNIFVPTQVLCSGSDFVVERQPQQQFYQKLPHPKKEWHVLQGFYHDTLGEKDRHIAIEKIRRFISTLFAEAYQPAQLFNADRIGASCATAEEISTVLPKASLQHWFWQFSKANLKIGSKFSKGLQLGEETGYDSGSTLDFVYRNQAESQNFLGNLIDQQYLAAIGWRGIRVRKQHLEQLLKKYAEDILQHSQPLKILDIAAGHGRYILDAVATFSKQPESILLRDYSEINVKAGQELIQQRGLNQIAQFQQGDAFDRTSLEKIESRPNLVVVSGLYELFSDNLLLQQSLAGIAQSIEKDGYLIYTGQIWHPQQEFIARALTSHRQGQAWVMRLRSQAEIDALVEQAGFRKIDQCIDEFGIFTVSVAQRIQDN